MQSKSGCTYCKLIDAGFKTCAGYAYVFRNECHSRPLPQLEGAQPNMNCVCRYYANDFDLSRRIGFPTFLFPKY
jgi:hypothetical protein